MNLIQIRYILKAHESQFMIYFASRSAQENERKKEESNKKKVKKITWLIFLIIFQFFEFLITLKNDSKIFFLRLYVYFNFYKDFLDEFNQN